jgi:GT2 family glycosyltransferase
MELSIIIVNYNTKELLKDCLNSLYENSPGLEFEVIVSDNNSTDGSAEMVKSAFPQACLIVNPINLGFAGANNVAIRECAGKFILLLNSDTLVLDSDSFTKMVSYMRQHPEVGVLGCKLLNSDRSLQPSYGRFPSLVNEFRQKIINFVFVKGLEPFKGSLIKDYDKTHKVDWVTGACMMVPREAINQAGLLDEDYFMYFEDADWCKRIGSLGWETHYFPDAQIIHFLGGSAPYVRKISLIYKTSQLTYYKKNRGAIELLTLRVFQIARYMMALFNLWFKSVFFKELVSEDLQKTREIIRLFVKG